METVRIQTDASERIEILALDETNSPITGVTDLLLTIRSADTGYYLDFADMTMKGSGWTTRLQTLTELDATNEPGVYYYVFNTSLIINPIEDDTYYLRVDQSPGTTVKNLPQVGELKVGQYIDYIDTEISNAGIGIAANVADAVWDELFSDHEDENTMGYIMKLIRALVTAEMEQDPVANEWIIKDPDTGVPWIRFDTTNSSGDPASVAIYKRIPK